MVFGRRRRELRRRGPATGGPEAEQRIGTRFVMRQKMFAFGDVFVVTDEHGTKMFEVDGKVFRLRDQGKDMISAPGGGSARSIRGGSR